MSVPEKHPIQSSEETVEAWREALRRIPGVVVHERTRFGPFVPDPRLRVIGPLDVRELMGRCDPDDDETDLPRSEE